MAEYLVITGLSGAGRSTAAATLEDLGWVVIDNLPPSLILQVSEMALTGGESEKVALVSGRSGAAYVEELTRAIDLLRRSGRGPVRVLFLDAADDVLVRRFEGTRRRHPVDADTVGEGIERERESLATIKAQADVRIDTTELNVHQLRDRLVDLFEPDPVGGMRTSVVSFGYQHGIPLDVDLVFDCRFLPNPHWVDELRPLTGLDAAVRDYVLAQPDTKEFLARLDDLFALVLPGYVKEGKTYLSVAVGCTGGRHRSVVLAEEVARSMEAHGFRPVVNHRDLAR
ncbi:MAG TPA: RNase adapter RapZ [Acidimicrobiales bacterium]|nr:RNase adapter RapZ [Acidimicrobiales bacterium]